MPLPQNADFRDEGEALIYMLRAAIERSNQSIFKTNQDIPDNPRPMGTTVLSCIVTPKKVYVGNLGDSRCYHFRDGEIVARTEDHSWVDEQVKLGLMSKAEAETDPRKNVVTRCAGTHPEVVVDTYAWDLFPGDMLMLCSDGLVNMVPDNDIKAIFLENGSAAEIAQTLVNRANENGGKDNITVIIAHISPSPVRMMLTRLRSFLRKNGLSVGWIIFLILYGLISAGIGYALQLFYPLSDILK
jgi:protein phosphatase